MKIPGVGEVKKPYLYAGGAFLVGFVGYAYMRNRKAKTDAANTAATDTSSADAIDPTTGLPYSQESGVYGFGGVDPSTGVPYMYENQTGTTTTTTSSAAFTTNSAWLSQAQQDAENLFGATYALATSALGKYLAQSNAGLNDNEYLLVQEVVAELGPPPVGTFRLIHASTGGDITTPPPSGGGGSGGGGNNANHVKVTVVRFGNPAPWNSTMWGIAQHYGYGSGSSNYLSIWNDPMNSALKTNRGTPTRIQAGDTVWVIPK